MKRSSGYVVILLLLVLIIALLGFFILRRKPAEPEPVETPSVTASEEPLHDPTRAPEAPAPTDSPAPTEEPVFETRPPVETDAPEETPEPTPTPTPDASGSITSSTGTGLNIRADWYTLPGGTQMQVDVQCVSYSIFTAAQWQSIQLTVGDQTYAADSKAVSYDGKDQVTSPLASFTVAVPASGTPISVTWNYKGSYSGKELPTITASGSILY